MSSILSSRSLALGASAIAVFVAAACSSDTSATTQIQAPTAAQQTLLNDGFTTPTATFSETNNSFVGASDEFAAWVPPGFITGTFAHDDAELMGGGLGADFSGGLFARTFIGRGDDDDGDRGPFEHFGDRNCTFTASSGRITCPSATFGGVTVTRSFAYTDAKGTAQAKFDSTTNAINTQVTVKGAFVSRHHDTTTVDNASNQTVSGLAKGSTQRTVNGTSGGTETTRGVRDSGQVFVAVRTIGDTTTNLVVPVSTDDHPSYPKSGTVVRAMTVTVTVGTTPAVTSTRREVITYDGSATAKVDITKNGTTQHCTQPLPHGHLTCS